MLKPDLADFLLKLKEMENDEVTTSMLRQKNESDNDSFSKIKMVVGKDGAGIQDVDLVGYELVVTLDNGTQKTLGNIRGPRGIDGHTPTVEELISIIKPLIPEPRNGRDGKDAKPLKKSEIVKMIKSLIPEPPEPPEPVAGRDGKDGKDGSPDSGDDIINKINLVKKDGPKIKAEHVEGIKDLGTKIFKEQDYIHRGGTKIRIKEVDGSPNVAELKELIVPNGSLTDNGNGSLTLNITGGFTEVAITGTIDDSNDTFTCTTEPTYVVINGVWYKDTGGVYTWSWSANTLTLSGPIGTGSVIWAFA